jgi:hypothetical protein
VAELVKPVISLCLTYALGALTSAAIACEPMTEAVSLERRIASSRYVFMAEVQSAVIKGRWLEVQFTDVVSYKDEAPAFNVARTPSDGAACGMSVTVPSKQWFFTDENGYFYSGGGSQLAGTPEGAEMFKKVFPNFKKMLREKANKYREGDG